MCCEERFFLRNYEAVCEQSILADFAQVGSFWRYPFCCQKGSKKDY
jgi:hypothetical protein